MALAVHSALQGAKLQLQLMLLVAGLTAAVAALPAQGGPWQHLGRGGGAAAGLQPQQQQFSSLRQGSTSQGGDVARSGGTSPLGVRLALSDSDDAMVVRWSTQLPTAEACVQYHAVPLAPADASHRAGSSSRTSGSSMRSWQAAEAGPKLPGHAAAGSGMGMGSRTSSGGSSLSWRLQALEMQWSAAGGSHPVQSGPEPPGATACGSSSAFVEPATGQASQRLHTVVLQGLAAGRQYRYRCGSEGGGWSDWRLFVAKRNASQITAAEPAQLLIVGDLGYYNSQTLDDILTDMLLGSYDALLHVGDIAYDMQDLEGRRASQFLGMVEPVAAALPYMVVPGNHEWHWNFTHYRSLFAMPGRHVGENLFYSFDVGQLHVLVYNTEVFFWPELFGQQQMRLMYGWMEADLQAVDRQRTPWVLAAGHRPMYCVAAWEGHCNEEHEASRRGIPSVCPHNNPLACRPLYPAGGGPTYPIEQLFYRYGVDLAVYGHVHDYERFWPAYNLTTMPGASSGSLGHILEPLATVHLTSGAGGNAEMKKGAEAPPQGPCNDTAPWCAFQSGYFPRGEQSSDYSYSRLKVFNATHLRWQQYSSTFGRVVDDWWLVQHEHGSFSSRSSGPVAS